MLSPIGTTLFRRSRPTWEALRWTKPRSVCERAASRRSDQDRIVLLERSVLATPVSVNSPFSLVSLTHVTSSLAHSLRLLHMGSIVFLLFLFLQSLALSVDWPLQLSYPDLESIPRSNVLFEEKSSVDDVADGLVSFSFLYANSDRCGYTDRFSVIGHGVQLWITWNTKRDVHALCSTLKQFIPFLSFQQCNEGGGDGMDLLQRIEFSDSASYSILLIDTNQTIPLSSLFPIPALHDVSLHMVYSSSTVSTVISTCSLQPTRLPLRLQFPERHGYHNTLLLPIEEGMKDATLLITLPRGVYCDLDELQEWVEKKQLPPFQSIPSRIDCEAPFRSSHPSLLFFSLSSISSSSVSFSSTSLSSSSSASLSSSSLHLLHIPFHLRTVLPHDTDISDHHKTILLPSITLLNESYRLPYYSEPIELSIPAGDVENPSAVLVWTIITLAVSTLFLLVEFSSSRVCCTNNHQQYTTPLDSSLNRG